MRQLTREGAEALYKTEWWLKTNQISIATFQITQDRLCCPFGIFQQAVEKTLERPVWTHEFGVARDKETITSGKTSYFEDY